MKFKYKKYGQGIIRPVIPIEIVHKNLAVPYEALVDSGADFCIFDIQIGNILGIAIEKGRIDFMAGVTGIKEPVYFHKMIIKIGGWPHEVEIAFGDIARFGYGIVGQRGFFDLFTLKFDYQKEEVELKPNK